MTVSDEAFHVAAYIWMAHAVHRSLCKDRLLYGVQKYSSVCDICLIFVLIQNVLRVKLLVMRQFPGDGVPAQVRIDGFSCDVPDMLSSWSC